MLDGADAVALAEALAADLPLLPATESLPEIALAMAEGRPPRPRRSGLPRLPPEMTVEAALPFAVGHLLDMLLSEIGQCGPDAGPRGVHQSRVALRRLRSLVKLLRPKGSPEDSLWAEWAGELAELARVLGAARDWDVFLPGIATGALQALGGDPRLRRLARAAEAERRAAYAALDQALAAPAFRRCILRGAALAASAAPGGTPLQAFAARLLGKRWKRLRRAARNIETLEAPALHELRLDAKRLRYAAEPFAHLWPGRRARRFARRLAALQEALGLANDAAVARDLAARLGGRGAGAFAIGTVTGFAAGRAEGSRLAAIAAWKELARTRRFWPKQVRPAAASAQST
jgi:CHAD domain-containing protein